MVKLQFSEAVNRWHITIPAAMVKRQGWIKGQELIWSFNERGQLELYEAGPEKKGI